MVYNYLLWWYNIRNSEMGNEKMKINGFKVQKRYMPCCEIPFSFEICLSSSVYKLKPFDTRDQVHIRCACEKHKEFIGLNSHTVANQKAGNQ